MARNVLHCDGEGTSGAAQVFQLYGLTGNRDAIAEATRMCDFKK